MIKLIAPCLAVAAVATSILVAREHRSSLEGRAVPSSAIVQVSVPTAAVPMPRVETAESHLRGYVLGVMQSWPHSTVPAADYNEVARDIAATVVAEPAEKSRWRNGWETGESKAVLLATLGYIEGSRFAQYVDELRCNDPRWRKSHADIMKTAGDCDKGYAWSVWQIHPIKGDDLCTLDQVRASRAQAAACALSIARRSV